VRVRKRCLACGRSKLYLPGMSACTHLTRIGLQCRGPLEAVRRKSPVRRALSIREAAARRVPDAERMVARLADEVAGKAASLVRWQRRLAKDRLLAAMTPGEEAALVARRKDAAAKALETRSRSRRRGLALQERA
jgi:hypothetical protein